MKLGRNLARQLDRCIESQVWPLWEDDPNSLTSDMIVGGITFEASFLPSIMAVADQPP
jgi:hypothetical protein